MALYHYTYAQKLASIYATGVLRVSKPSGLHEVGILWLSSNPHWEHSATKPMMNSRGEFERLPLREVAQMIGLFRFVVEQPDPDTLTWPMLAQAAGIRHKEREALMTIGRRLGALPPQWFGVLREAPVGSLPVEQLDPATMTWRRLTIAEALAWQPQIRILSMSAVTGEVKAA